MAGKDAIDQALDALFDAYWPIQPQMGRRDTDILSELPESAALRELSLHDRAEAATRAIERTSRAWRDWTKSDIKATWKDPAYISVKAFHFAASRLMASKLPLTEAQVARILKATAAAKQWNDSFFPIGRIVTAVDRLVQSEGLSPEIAELIRRLNKSLMSNYILDPKRSRLDRILRRATRDPGLTLLRRGRK